MSDKTKIEWCDSTFNPWWGCTKIAPGCDNCYAAAMDHRLGGKHWGGDYKQLSDANWSKPIKWHIGANKFYAKHGRNRRVFCASMPDVFANKARNEDRLKLFSTISVTHNLNWLILTKRPQNMYGMLPTDYDSEQWRNLWLGVTVEDRKHGLRRIEELKKLNPTVRFLSIEPLLEDLGRLDLSGIHWVIIGGETGRNARPTDPQWVSSILHQCRMHKVPVFFKQWGAIVGKGETTYYGTKIQEFPNVR